MFKIMFFMLMLPLLLWQIGCNAQEVVEPSSINADARSAEKIGSNNDSQNEENLSSSGVQSSIAPSSVGGDGIATGDLAKTELETEVFSLVRQRYQYGVSYQKVHSMSKKTIPFLLGLLGNADLKADWPNIVDTLGYMEDSAAFKGLVDFVENFEGEADEIALNALLGVPYALSCIAANGDEAVFDYLKQHVTPESWRSVTWTFPNHDVAQLLAERTISTIPLSGRDDVPALLERLKSDLSDGARSMENAVLLMTVKDGFSTHQKIKSMGRAKFLDRLNQIDQR